MKILLIIIAVSFSQLSFSNLESPITNFQGSKEEVRTLFDSLWGKFKSFDNFHCYRRAHILSYEMEQKNIISGKVFFFKGEKLEMPKNWYYHVAPYVLHEGSEVVLDKGLFEGATYLSDWLTAFGDGNKCLRVYSYDDYLKSKKSEICMYFLVSRYFYGPLNLQSSELDHYNPEDLTDMLFALSPRMRKKYLKENPIN